MAKGYGFANLKWGVPATAETVYEIASLTKLFTAISIMIRSLSIVVLATKSGWKAAIPDPGRSARK